MGPCRESRDFRYGPGIYITGGRGAGAALRCSVSTDMGAAGAGGGLPASPFCSSRTWSARAATTCAAALTAPAAAPVSTSLSTSLVRSTALLVRARLPAEDFFFDEDVALLFRAIVLAVRAPALFPFLLLPVWSLELALAPPAIDSLDEVPFAFFAATVSPSSTPWLGVPVRRL